MDLSSAVWRKSSYSCANGCVEVASVGDHVAVRDSKDRGGPELVFTASEWNDFLGRVKLGELQRVE